MAFDYNLHVFHSPKFQSVVEDTIRFFVQTPTYQLPPPDRFTGSGVYALYYLGAYDLYARIADLNQDACTQPIYVGKAVPAGWRTARTQSSETPVLCQRLKEHARSIQQVAHLQLADFLCRFTILSGIESDLVVPVEAELIRRYKPLWNTIVDGFGNHDPGAGRTHQARSEWDILHPGRTWAGRLTGESPSREMVISKVKAFLASSPFA